MAKADQGPLSVEIQKRAFRLMLDARMMATVSDREIREVYCQIKATRDRLSELLDRVDGKHV